MEVEGPDGTIVEFPDGMPHADITAVMARHFPKPQNAGPSWLDKFVGNVREPIQPLVGADQNALVDLSTPEGRQHAADFLAQTAGTAGGIALGTPGGPPGMAAGGAAGNVFGKKLSRYVMGGEQPDLAESTVDAGVGAVGPIVGSAARTGARYLTGLSREGVTTAETEGAAEIARLTKMRDAKNRTMKGAQKGDPDVEEILVARDGTATRSASATEERIRRSIEGLKNATRAQVDDAVEAAIERASSRSARSTLGFSLPGAIAGSLIEPVTGSLIGAGVSHELVRRAVPALLTSKHADTFARWALNVPKGAKSEEVAASLMGIAAEAGIKLEAETRAPTPRPDRRSDAAKPARDNRGRFASVSRERR